MVVLSKEQIIRREKTLLVAFLLSAPGPLLTGMAVLSSHSITQLADFVRRTVELVALFLSWWIFRHLYRSTVPHEETRVQLERKAGLSVAGTMLCTGIVMLVLAISRVSVFEPGGNVNFGLVIAILGMVFNSMFWWRYTALTREQYSSVIASQRDLYRAKAFVDFCVVTALAAVAIAPLHPMTRYIDTLGSVTVAVYLFWSGLQTAQKHFIAG